MSLAYYRALMNQGGPDPDATAFLTAIGNTDPTIDTATQNLFKDLKSNGLYTKVKAFYPMVGGTASSHKFNMVNPVDTDAAFRLTFTGSWTHSSTGALPSSAYANTHLNPFVAFGGSLYVGVSFYSRTDATTGTDQLDFGVRDGTEYLWGSIRYKASGFDTVLGRNTSGSGASLLQGGVVTDSLGLIQVHKSSVLSLNTAALYKNGTQLDAVTDNAPQPNRPIYLGGWNANGSPGLYTNRECATFTITEGLSSSEAATFNTIIQDFQTTLGRNV